MTDFEHNLAQIVHEIVPAPPRVLDPDDIFRVADHNRGPRAIAVAVTAVCIVIIAATIVLFGNGRTRQNQSVAASTGSSSPTPDPTESTSPVGSDTDPADLVGKVWVLAAVTDHSQPEPPSAGMQFHFQYESITPGPISILAGRCSTATAVLSPGNLVFAQEFVSITQANCGPNLGVPQSNFAFRSVLTGSVTWAIKGGKLTITQPGVGSLTFQNGSRNDLIGSLFASGGPCCISNRSMSGDVTITSIDTAETVTLTVEADGSFATDLPSGHYAVTGQGPLYGGQCKDYSGPVAVTPGTPVFIAVTCEER